jgi:hypothetical protein
MQQPYPVITPPRVGPEPENRHLFSEYHEPQTSYFQIDNDMIDSINGDEEFSNTMADYGLDPCDLLPCDPMAEETNEDDISSFTESNSAFSSPEIPASDHFQRHIYITENLMPTDGYQPTPIAGNTMHPVLMQENLCHAQGQATFIFTTTTPDIARQNSGYNDHGYSQTGPQNTFFPSDTTCGSPRVSPFTGTPWVHLSSGKPNVKTYYLTGKIIPSIYLLSLKVCQLVSLQPIFVFSVEKASCPSTALEIW